MHRSVCFRSMLLAVVILMGFMLPLLPTQAQSDSALDIALRDVSQRVGRPLDVLNVWRYFIARGYFTGGQVACGQFSPTRIRGDEPAGWRVEVDIDLKQYNYVMGDNGTPLILCSTLDIPAPNFPTNTPIPSPTPRYTYTPSPTFTPTATFTASATFTPTMTFTPSTTPRPNAVFCPGDNGMTTRLALGEQGRVLPGYTLNLRTQPGEASGDAIRPMYENNTFTVTSEPVCDEQGRAWWLVSYSSSSGWMVEGSGGEYYVEPLLPQVAAAQVVAFATNTPAAVGLLPTLTLPAPTQPMTPRAPTPVFCAGGNVPTPPRLVIGQYGRVTPGEPNNLRDAPASNAGLVGQIPGGDVFRVVAGPDCDYFGRPWWRVEYEGLTGWTVEGEDGVYFVEPIGTAP